MRPKNFMLASMLILMPQLLHREARRVKFLIETALGVCAFKRAKPFTYLTDTPFLTDTSLNRLWSLSLSRSRSRKRLIGYVPVKRPGYSRGSLFRRSSAAIHYL